MEQTQPDSARACEQSLARARKALETVGSARLYFNCVIGLNPSHAAPLRQALRHCDAALADRPGDARALRLKGRLLAALGEGGRARDAFAGALRADPRSAEGWAWRAESWLLEGRLREAGEDLERAVRETPRWPWARLLRCVQLLSCGREDAAEAELRALGPQVRRDRAARSAWLAARGLLEGQRGRPERGARLLDEALARDRSGWLLGLRGMLRRGAGDADGGLADFDAAERLEPSPWVYSQRADALCRGGFYQRALADLSTLARLLPAAPEPHAQAANVYFDQAFYREALEAIGRALRLRPGDASLHARRAKFHLALNRLREAQRDLGRALALDPGSPQLAFERLLVLILRGRLARASRELSRARLAPGGADYLRGYLECRRRRYAAARPLFASAAAAMQGEAARRARYYALVAGVLAEAPRKRAPGTDLVLCGIGIRHPYQATVEALRALASCRVLYNNIGDPQIMEFLGLFPGEVRPVTRAWEGTARGRAELIARELRRGRAAGFVTRIHPFIYRRIAKDLVELCRKRDIRFRSFGAVSLTEVLWGLADAQPRARLPRRRPAGLRVFDIDFLTRNPQLLRVRDGALVYCIADAARRSALAALLAGRYPAEHRFFLLAGSGDKEDQVIAAGARELESRLLSLDSGALLFAPPSEGKGRR